MDSSQTKDDRKKSTQAQAQGSKQKTQEMSKSQPPAPSTSTTSKKPEARRSLLRSTISSSAKSSKSVTFSDNPTSTSAGAKSKKHSSPKHITTTVHHAKKGSTNSGPARTSKTVPASINGGTDKHKKPRSLKKTSASSAKPVETLVPSAAAGPAHQQLVPKVNARQVPPKCPDLPLCSAYPGTKEWDDYWKLFEAAMGKYNAEMAEFQDGMKEFSHDLDRCRNEAKRIQAEEKLAEKLDLKPPAITSQALDQVTVFNGYVLEARNMNAIVSSQLGRKDGIRVELNVKGIDQHLIQIGREFNILTVSVMNSSSPTFLRIGVPTGKSAEDLEIYPPVYSQSIMIIDSR